MSIYLHRFNLILLLSLGALCVFQWDTEKTARTRIGSLLKEREDLTHQLTEQTDSLHAANEDLDTFRKQILALKVQTDEETVTIRTQKSDISRLEATDGALTRQLEHWKQAVDEYHASIEARDEQIKLLVEQRDRFYEANKTSIERANSAVAALNDLNGKYSDVVTRYNDLVAQTQAQTQAATAAAAAPKGG